MTGGLREGVSRCVGEAVRDFGAGALNSSKNKVIAVGVAPWGMVNNRQQLVNPKVRRVGRRLLTRDVRDVTAVLCV